MNCLAQEIIISLYRDAPKDQTIDDRSLSMEPTASHDRNVIYIHSDIAIENMQITIRDKHKNLIYINQLTHFYRVKIIVSVLIFPVRKNSL